MGLEIVYYYYYLIVSYNIVLSLFSARWRTQLRNTNIIYSIESRTMVKSSLVNFVLLCFTLVTNSVGLDLAKQISDALMGTIDREIQTLIELTQTYGNVLPPQSRQPAEAVECDCNSRIAEISSMEPVVASSQSPAEIAVADVSSATAAEIIADNSDDAMETDVSQRLTRLANAVWSPIPVVRATYAPTKIPAIQVIRSQPPIPMAHTFRSQPPIPVARAVRSQPLIPVAHDLGSLPPIPVAYDFGSLPPIPVARAALSQNIQFL